MTELTPAEQAAVDAMGALCVPPGDIEEVAPAVVAAVRGPLFRDPKERLRLALELATGSTLTTAEALEAVDCALNAHDKRRIQADALVDAAEMLDRFATRESRQPLAKHHIHGRTLASGIDAAAKLVRDQATRLIKEQP